MSGIRSSGRVIVFDIWLIALRSNEQVLDRKHSIHEKALARISWAGAALLALTKARLGSSRKLEALVAVGTKLLSHHGRRAVSACTYGL